MGHGGLGGSEVERGVERINTAIDKSARYLEEVGVATWVGTETFMMLQAMMYNKLYCFHSTKFDILCL